MRLLHTTDRTAPPRDRGVVRTLQVGWSIAVVPVLLFYVLALTSLWEALSAPPASLRARLLRLGVSLEAYAALMWCAFLLFAAACLTAGALIAWRKFDDRLGLVASLFLICFGALNVPLLSALMGQHPQYAPLAELAATLVWTMFVMFAVMFPDARFVPRWTRWFVVLFAASLLAALATGGSLAQPSPTWVAVPLFAGMLVAAGAQIYRYRRVSTPTQRQQTKWVACGVVAAMAIQLTVLLSGPYLPALTTPELRDTFYEPLSALIALGYTSIPLAVAIAVLRYRLWDIDPLIGRTLLYAALTGCVAGMYVLIIGYLGALFRVQSNLIISLVATGVVAVVFQPLRARLQQAIFHMLYGERDDPYAVVERLGLQLESSLAPNAILPSIVTTLREALKLPYVSIALGSGDRMQTAAEAGTPPAAMRRDDAAPGLRQEPATVALPLTFNGATVGHLIVAGRDQHAPLSSADLRVLAAVARQAGAAAHAVLLADDLRTANAALRRSRERLVLSREEERRRLRRDLHDGLGPTLASLAQRIDAARVLVASDPGAAERRLAELKTHVRGTVDEIRRLVYELRPPALDEFGLVTALREHVAQHIRSAGVEVELQASRLPQLPAAVEVAVYRIALEALTNVVRHSGARHCSVLLGLDDALLCLEVRDDGRGLEPATPGGVGLRSMRERVEELGGSLIISKQPAGGTAVVARLPICAS